MHPTAVLIDRFRRTYLKVKEGPKHLHVVPMAGVRVVRLTLKECEELALRELDYPLDKALAHFRAAAERLGLGAEIGVLFSQQPPHSETLTPRVPGPRETATGAAAQLTLFVAPPSQETTSWTEHTSTHEARSNSPPATIQTTDARTPRRRETTRSRTPTTGRRAMSP